jgi:flagellar hook assembly protein FlgD
VEVGFHMTASFAMRHPRVSKTLAAAAVAVVAVLVAVWATPRASGAAATWLRTAPVHLKTLRADEPLAVAGPQGRGAGAPTTLNAGMTFSMVALLCDVPPAGAVTIRLRTSGDGHSWGPWFTAPLEVADERGTAQAFIDPIWTGAGQYAQVEAARNGRRGPSSLSGVRLVAIDPTEDAGVAARVTGVVRRFAATVAGLSLTADASAATAGPAIVTRAAWGADESLRSGSPSYAPVKMAFIHHTASGNDYTQADAPAIVRAIYAYHTKSLHWSDIGYNFLIDRFGTIYEGRYGGVARGVVGAQAGGFNTGSTGIAVVGTFMDQAPPTETINALEQLLAWKLAVSGVAPAGSATLTCGLTDKYVNGAKVTFPVIAGHRQANYTECPGDAFYALLPAIRANVVSRVGSAVNATVRASASLISPNGDGVLDVAQLDIGISTAADWRLMIKDAGGRTVASWTGQGASADVTWNGTSGGSDVPDGVYTAELTAIPAGGDPTSASTQVTVDTTAPRLTGAAVAPASFSPNGDGQNETASVTYAPAEACSVRVGVLDADGAVVRWLHGWQARSEKSYTVAWDGRITSGSGLTAAPDGLYRFDVERRDAAGNVARQGLKVSIDRTLASPSARPVTFSPNGDGVRDSVSVGFTLARKARVTVRVSVGGRVVRTLASEDLAAGARTVNWDGRDDSGKSLASCRPDFTVTAVSAFGESSVAAGLVVDVYRPRLYAPVGKSTTAGTSTHLGLKAADPFSAKVDVSYVVTDAKGRRVASGHPGWKPAGKSLTVAWKPASRGVFTVTWHGVDLGGNHEAGAVTTVVRVS